MVNWFFLNFPFFNGPSDSSYELFYQAEDYPVVKYLRQPLYFEVELMESTDPQLELILENCWATLNEERTSLPSWDIIVDRWSAAEHLTFASESKIPVVFNDPVMFFPAVRTVTTAT